MGRLFIYNKLRIFLKVWSNELPDIYLSVSRACHKCQNVLWLKSQPQDIEVASTRYLRTSQNFSTLKHEILIVIITFWSWLYPFQWQYQSQNIFAALEQKLRVSSAIGKKLQHAPGMYVGYICNKSGADFQHFKWWSPWRLTFRWRVQNTSWDLFTEQKSEGSLKLRYRKLFLDSKRNNCNDIIIFEVHFLTENISGAYEMGVSCPRGS